MKTRYLQLRGSKAKAFPRTPHDAPALPEESVAGLVTISVHSLGGVRYHEVSKGKKERDDLSLTSSPAPAKVVVWCNGSKSTGDCNTTYLPSHPMIEESMDDEGNIAWRCDWPAEEKLTAPVAIAGNKTDTVSLHIGVRPHGQAVQPIGVATVSLPEPGDESHLTKETDHLSIPVEPLKQKVWSPSRFGIGPRKMRAEYSISSSAILRLGLRVDRKLPSSPAMVIDTPLACVISTHKNGQGGSAISHASAEWPDDEVAHPAPLASDDSVITEVVVIDSVESAPKSLTSSIETERICNNGSQTGVASVEGSKTSSIAAPSEASGRNNPCDDITAITVARKEEQCVVAGDSGTFKDDVSDASGREQISDFSPSISAESRMSCQYESSAVHQVEDSNAVSESAQEQANAEKSVQRGFNKTVETQYEEFLAFIELKETTSDVSGDLTAGSFDAVPMSPREKGRVLNSQTEDQSHQQPQELDEILRNEVNICGAIVGEALDDVLDGLKDIVSCGLCVEELLHGDDVTCRTDRTSLETFESTVAKSHSSAPQAMIVDENCSVGTEVIEVNSGRAKVFLAPARCGNSTVTNKAAPEINSEQHKECDKAVNVPSVGVSVKPESTDISAPSEKIIPKEKFVFEDLSSLHSMYSV